MIKPKAIVNPQQVERYRQKYGKKTGIKQFLKDNVWAWVIPAGIVVGTVWWKFRCDKKAKIAVQDNASKNRIAEQNNISKNRKAEQDNATSNKKDEINAQTIADVDIIRAKCEAQKEVINLREDRRKERMQRQEELDAPLCDESPLESHSELKAKGLLDTNRQKEFGATGVRVGLCRGFAGPNHVGKTSYLLQEASLIAGGNCLPMTADEHSIPPVQVIYFALENEPGEIEEYYGNMVNPVEEHLHIYEGQIMPSKIVQTVKEYLPLSNEYGVVVYIDNEVKMEEYAPRKEIVWMKRELEQMRQSAPKTGHPLTPVYVYHTSSNYDPSKPFTLQCVRGDKSRVLLNNDFDFLTYTSLGDDKRILGHLKRKHAKENGIVNVLKFAGTEVDQFSFVGNAKEVDVLCTKNPQDNVPNPAAVFNPHKTGRKSTITDEKARALWDMVKRREKTWKQIEAETGHKEKKIKARVKSLNDKAVKP